jgi:hypothetical protein
MLTGTLPDARAEAGEVAYPPAPSDGHLDLLADFRAELQQLTATQRELLQELRSDAGINLDEEELPRLRKENEQLRARVEQLEQLLRESPNGSAQGPAVSDEPTKRQRADVAAQRLQLEEDEAALMQQMREMEMALAKDRAELARQRTELQRQQADFAREIEIASRDPELRERLAILRPGQHENLRRDNQSAGNKGSGLIRRLFG